MCYNLTTKTGAHSLISLILSLCVITSNTAQYDILPQPKFQHAYHCNNPVTTAMNTNPNPVSHSQKHDHSSSTHQLCQDNVLHVIGTAWSSNRNVKEYQIEYMPRTPSESYCYGVGKSSVYNQQEHRRDKETEHSKEPPEPIRTPCVSTSYRNYRSQQHSHNMTSDTAMLGPGSLNKVRDSISWGSETKIKGDDYWLQFGNMSSVEFDLVKKFIYISTVYNTVSYITVCDVWDIIWWSVTLWHLYWTGVNITKVN